MEVIKVRNVGQALVEGCYLMNRSGVERDSRNGKVLVLPTPLTTVYERPTERVLFDSERDANPFFHLMEALWMLNGGRDVAFPAQFNAKFGQFSDDGVVFNGAYGYRWRTHFGNDQLRSIIGALKTNPDCRRQVLTMWDGSHDLGNSSKDVPCNLLATFQIGPNGNLDMMVSNRSNDLVWGAYGANSVHFSYLLEYMASAIGVPVGTYTQVSANTHIYLDLYDGRELMRKLAALAPMPPTKSYPDLYSIDATEPFPLVNIQHGRWERELDTFIKMQHRSEYADPFFQHVAKPMAMAYVAFKEKTNVARFRNARLLCYNIVAKDWARACLEWLDRREAKA